MDSKQNFAGIVTATGEVMSDPGALRIADNVTLRKQGALTLRAFFGSTALARQYRAAFPYRGTLWYIGASNAIYRPAEAQVYYAGFHPPPAIRDDIQSAKEARDNLYIASATGTWKVQTPGATELERTGLSASDVTLSRYAFANTGTPLILAVDQQVAYRAVAKRTDANGVVIRSRPTGALRLINTVAGGGSNTPASPGLYVGIRSGSGVEEVEVYRTRVFPTTATPDDEMQLVGTFKASQFSGGFLTWTDRTLDIARGTTLYTSPSRGGIEGANDRPPGAACVERYRGSLFFGNIRGPARTTFSYKLASPSTNGDVSGQATGLGRRATTGNTTAGGSNITSVASTVGIQVGMLVQSIPGATNVNSRVTAIAGSTVTVSPAANNTASGVSLSFHDVISVTVNGSPNLATPTLEPSSPNTNALGGPYTTAYDVTPPEPGYDVTVVLESTERGNPYNLSIAATHGNEFSPPLSLVSSGYVALPVESLPNGLMWSEPDEPEHVPPKNFARVGDAGKAILALVATRDRLLILKEDGVFMLTGDTAANFSIYPLDTTCLCILPGSVRRLQNTVYFLSNLGLIAIDENGSTSVVSRPIQNELAPIVTAIRQAQKTSGLYLMPGLTGVTGTADDANGEYWLALGSTTPSFGGQVLVWNAFQEGYTTYSFGTPAPAALAQDGEGLPLVLTASSLLTPSTSLGAITARISPHAFSDPALGGKLWTHICAGFSRLTGTTSVTARFSGSASQVPGTEVAEVIPLPLVSGLVELPQGTLMKHPLPRAMARAFLSFVELVVAVASGTFTLDVIGTESRDNIPNKQPTHGSGAT